MWVKKFDKIYTWPYQSLIKWPFGFLLLWFILLQIWNLETMPNYNEEIISKIKSIQIPHLSFRFKLFDNSRMIR